eukprot:gene11216-3270_t
MVDYSKWERMARTIGEEKISKDGDVVSENSSKTKPAVYRIGPSGSVTIPGRNVTIHSSSTKTLSAKDSVTHSVTNPSDDTEKLRKENIKLLGLTQVMKISQLTRNGGQTDKYFWSQTESSIRICFIVPGNCRAKDVNIAIDSANRQMHVQIDTSGVLHNGILFGPISDLSLNEDIDWTLVTTHLEDDMSLQQHTSEGDSDKQIQSLPMQYSNMRLLQVDLQKKDLNGLVLWWKSAFKGDTEINIDNIVDRSAERKAASSKFSETFKKAHEMFVQQMQDTYSQKDIDTKDP